ncbi:MAG: ACP S-malonyltransferase [Myxococcota bacterium]
MGTALLFPGQGAQYVGMDAGLDRATFEEADDALGFALSWVIREGPEGRLAETEITQPAILATSIAALRARPVDDVVAAAGHSLGEYGALVAAGALAFADAVRLVRLRGRAMQQAVPLGVGAMAAIVGPSPEEVQALCDACAEGEVVEIAALNCPGQTVVAGHVGAVERVLARSQGRRLPVSAPFHCSLLAPAAERLREALADVRLGPCRFPVVHDVDARPSDDIRARLVEQVVKPVRWVECVATLKALGATSAVELAPGRTLAGLCKRIDRAWTVR